MTLSCYNCFSHLLWPTESLLAEKKPKVGVSFAFRVRVSGLGVGVRVSVVPHVLEAPELTCVCLEGP